MQTTPRHPWLDSLPLSKQQGATLPCWQQYAHLQHRHLAAPTFSSTSPSGCTTTQPQHTWPSVIFCRRSYRLEFASRWAPRSRPYRKHFQTVAEDISSCAALVWTCLWRCTIQISFHHHHHHPIRIIGYAWDSLCLNYWFASTAVAAGLWWLFGW